MRNSYKLIRMNSLNRQIGAKIHTNWVCKGVAKVSNRTIPPKHISLEPLVPSVPPPPTPRRSEAKANTITPCPYHHGPRPEGALYHGPSQSVTVRYAPLQSVTNHHTNISDGA